MAKSSTLYSMIPEAEATGRCEVRTESYVFRVATNTRGRVTGVHYFDADKRAEIPGGEGGGAERQRRGNRAAAFDVGELAIP